MRSFLKKMVLLSCTAFLYNIVSAQEDWPKTILGSDSTIIKIYQPQPDSFAGNSLKSLSPISVLQKGNPDPVFSTLSPTSKLSTHCANRVFTISPISISTQQ